MVGVYQHCGEGRLHRCLAEFDFRRNRRAALKIADAERHYQSGIDGSPSRAGFLLNEDYFDLKITAEEMS